MVQFMKNNAAATQAQLEEQAEGMRTWFKEQMQLQDSREERMVRMFSEQTDRIQELRLENARAKGEGSTVHVKGLEKLEFSVSEAIKAATGAGERADKVAGEVAEMRKEGQKKRKKKITAPSGKQYVVEDQ